VSAALQAALGAVAPLDAEERAALEVLKGFAARLERPFARDQWPAHFTGSALVVSPATAQVCLVHHAKLGRWLQPGGHAESGDGGDLQATALREAREETGLEVRLAPGAPWPFDVDAHHIPARKTEPEHQHLDVRALLVTAAPQALRYDPGESLGAKWLSFDEALALSDEHSLSRLLRKARAQLRL